MKTVSVSRDPTFTTDRRHYRFRIDFDVHAPWLIYDQSVNATWFAFDIFIVFSCCTLRIFKGKKRIGDPWEGGGRFITRINFFEYVTVLDIFIRQKYVFFLRFVFFSLLFSRTFPFNCFWFSLPWPYNMFRESRRTLRHGRGPLLLVGIRKIMRYME